MSMYKIRLIAGSELSIHRSVVSPEGIAEGKRIGREIQARIDANMDEVVRYIEATYPDMIIDHEGPNVDWERDDFDIPGSVGSTLTH